MKSVIKYDNNIHRFRYGCFLRTNETWGISNAIICVKSTPFLNVCMLLFFLTLSIIIYILDIVNNIKLILLMKQVLFYVKN